MMSDAEAAAAFGDEDSPPVIAGEGADFDDDAPEPTADERIASAPVVEGVPEWAELPPGFAPPPGKRLGWMRFRADWTDAPQKGDRWCMMWTLSESEEKMAYKRSGGDSARVVMELAKATIRVIDGVKADRTGAMGIGSVNIFWAELGTKCRQMVTNYYLKSHTLSAEEQQDFFANCFVVTTAVAG
jgi:hypothetical protein